MDFSPPEIRLKTVLVTLTFIPRDNLVMRSARTRNVTKVEILRPFVLALIWVKDTNGSVFIPLALVNPPVLRILLPRLQWHLLVFLLRLPVLQSCSIRNELSDITCYRKDCSEQQKPMHFIYGS